MSAPPAEAARLPPPGITGLNPRWSRLVDVQDAATKSTVTWHLLDSWHLRTTNTDTAAKPELTLLCVHGNPSWSFLWRKVISAAPDDVRVIAVDQLDMGFSQRTGVKRTLATRIDDLCRLTDTLKLEGPVVTVAHDWGGPISLGWALRHLTPGGSGAKPVLKAVILTNTAVSQPESAAAPAIIRLIRLKWLLRIVTVKTAAFIRGAIVMSRPSLSKLVSDGFHAPYRVASRRLAIADFVADIPLSAEHESASTLSEIAAGLKKLSDVPALLLWGPRDKVFSDIYLNDLEHRLPQADVHRYPGAAHFVSEDADVAGAMIDWIRPLLESAPQSIRTKPEPQVKPDHSTEPEQSGQAYCALSDFSSIAPTTIAVTEIAPHRREISFADLQQRVDCLASGMLAYGVAPGARVAVMIMPGIDLATVVYACWRMGAVLVLVDSGLGRAGMQAALQGARPDYLIGINKALIAAKVLGWPGRRIAVDAVSSVVQRALQIQTDINSLVALGEAAPSADWPAADNLAAIAFTSGSTGPSKGVVYTQRQVRAQVDQLIKLYAINSKDCLVAAFAPFALYAPALGISSVVPDMDVTKPASLTAGALAGAVRSIGATLVFASPAALTNVVATAHTLDSDAIQACKQVRLGLSAGAPVRASLLQKAAEIFPNASMHTPYGMTEALPVADISLAQLESIESRRVTNRLADNASARGDDEALVVSEDAGVCVGAPVHGSTLFIDPLDERGKPNGRLTQQAGVLGEVLVSAEHIRHGYDRLWHTDFKASLPAGFHRSGDVGQLDSKGLLWIGGRLVHLIHTAKTVVAPVAYEQQIETLSDVHMAALVGVGERGQQLVVAVLQLTSTLNKPGAAPLDLSDRVRTSVGKSIDIAAVLLVAQLPVDKRHNSKVDRTALSIWADRVLAGERVTGL